MKLKKMHFALGAAVLALLLAGCSSPTPTPPPVPTAGAEMDFPAGSPMAKMHDSGVIKIGTQTGYPLLGLQELDGSFSGFDIEIGKIIASGLGIAEDKIEWVPVTTPTREPFLDQGKVDIVLAAYTINQSREDVIDFAGPYLESPNILMVPKGNPQNIRTIQDTIGKRLCTTSGGNQITALQNNYPEVVDSLVLFDSSAKCRDAVLNGSVDASTTELAIIGSFVAANPDKLEALELDKPYSTSSFYGIGLKQVSNPVLCNWINEQLGDAFKDGRWASAYNATLGTVLGDAPQPPTLAKCGDAASTHGQ